MMISSIDVVGRLTWMRHGIIRYDIDILLMSERDETKEIWVNKEIHSYHLRKRGSIVRVNHEIE